jgi:hypothetical protein
MSYESLFSHRSMKDIMNYMSSNNVATQVVDQKGGDNADPDFMTTGTAQCIVNGAFVASLADAATIDMSDDAVALDATTREGGLALAGRSLADTEELWLLFTTNAAGDTDGTFVRAASAVGVAVTPTLKIPFYNVDELTIGLCLFDNNGGTRAHIFGTTNLYDADCTFYQLIGPNLLPHVDNFDKN